MTTEREIPPERQIELRKLAFEIVRHLPKDETEIRFTLQKVEEILQFIKTGEWSLQTPRH